MVSRILLLGAGLGFADCQYRLARHLGDTEPEKSIALLREAANQRHTAAIMEYSRRLFDESSPFYNGVQAMRRMAALAINTQQLDVALLGERYRLPLVDSRLEEVYFFGQALSIPKVMEQAQAGLYRQELGYLDQAVCMFCLCNAAARSAAVSMLALCRRWTQPTLPRDVCKLLARHVWQSRSRPALWGWRVTQVHTPPPLAVGLASSTGAAQALHLFPGLFASTSSAQVLHCCLPQPSINAQSKDRWLEARELRRRGHYHAALEALREAARGGHAGAMYDLAMAFAGGGLSLFASQDQCSHWLRKAAKAGSPSAILMLGDEFESVVRFCSTSDDVMARLAWRLYHTVPTKLRNLPEAKQRFLETEASLLEEAALGGDHFALVTLVKGVTFLFAALLQSSQYFSSGARGCRSGRPVDLGSTRCRAGLCRLPASFRATSRGCEFGQSALFGEGSCRSVPQ